MLKKKIPNKSIFEYYKDDSSQATEFRRLIKNIRQYGNPIDINSILVTSAAKHEGKSLIATNLAISTAKNEKDKRVLLMDCDFRRPSLHSLFCIERKPGLSSLLEEDINIFDVAHNTELDNLKVIPSGHTSQSPIVLFSKMKEFMDKCKSAFDIVICDSPPIVPVDDASMIAPNVDGVLLVVMAGKTDRMVVKRAVDILNNIKGAWLLGIVLNNLNRTLPYYYDYKYYRYRYDNY
ncbi:MAG: CpsD/CapB family tyrosine-protein kinase [bacterium]